MEFGSYLLITAVTLLVTTYTSYTFIPRFLQSCGSAWGWHIRRSCQPRREILIARVKTDQRNYGSGKNSRATLDDEWEKVESGATELVRRKVTGAAWEGIIGFFHPFCNAGGGGERVLWAAIRATQQRWPNAVCVVYTGDHNVTKDQILRRVKERFNIHLHPPTIVFLYLSTRRYVLSNTWPHFTLLGQSLGSLLVAYDAFTLLAPDIFIDTMGYAFALAFCKLLFSNVPTAAYVHYPTISTDMLSSLDSDENAGHGLNAGAGRGWKGAVKRRYWHIFAWLYGRVGGGVDVVMTNSSWTQNHIQELWGSSRSRKKMKFPVEVLYPPCAVEELERAIDVRAQNEKLRQPVVLYIAQFRPEKDHQLVLKAFAKFLHSFVGGKTSLSAASPLSNTNISNDEKRPHLLLIGSVRHATDETHVYSLRLLAHELHITDHTTFLLNASWPTILQHLSTASVGVNAMWNEHFGIGVVEYQAAGLIPVVNDSGGPRADIVVSVEDSWDGPGAGTRGGPTGYLASTEDEFAEGFAKVFGLVEEEKVQMRLRARRNAKRFSEEEFEGKWLMQMERLIGLQTRSQI